MVSVIDRIKNTFPTSSDPEPEADISAADFDDTQNDVNPSDDDENSSDDGGGETGDESQQQNGDGAEQPDMGGDGSQQGEGDVDGEVGSDGAEQPQNGNNDQQSTDGDFDGDDAGEQTEQGAENKENQQQSGEGNPDDSDGPGDESQNSLFDYEDLEKLGDGDSDNNDSESGEKGNDSQENGNNQDGGNEGDSGEDDQVNSEEEQDVDGETPENGDGTGDRDDNDIPNDGEDGNEDGAADGHGESENDTDKPGEEGEDSDIDNGSEFPEDAEGDGETPGEKEIEPDNDGQERTDSEPFEPHPGMVESEQEKLDNEKENLENNLDGLEKEIEKMQKAMENDLSSDQAGGGSIDSVKMNTQPSTRTNDPRWEECKKEKDKEARLLRQRLERSRRDSYRRGKKAGQLDGMNMHKVATNQLDAFKQYSPGDDKEYALIISVDRSGSMGGTDIDIAERAMTQFALAMEDIGVDVCIIEMLNTEARVVLPFNVDVNTVKGDLLTGDTGGRTPLTDVIQIAKKRMKYSEKFPIMLSITDGCPDNPEDYLNEVEGCNMPVMGITVGSGGGRISNDADRYYDVHRGVSTVDDLTDEMEKMIMKITF